MNDYQNGHAEGVTLLATQENPIPSSVFVELNTVQAGANGHTNGSAGKVRLHPELLIPRLGEYLMELGLLRANEMAHALQVQRCRREEGQHVLLGQLLVDLGYLDRATLDHAVTMHVIELHNMLANQNRRLEQQVAERTAQLKEALKRANRMQEHKDAFVGAISHELRTPLTVIIGYLDLLRRGEIGPIAPVQQDVLGSMQLASDRLLHIINNLLFFATLHRNEFMVKHERVLIKDLFRSALKKNIYAARDRNIRLFVSLADNVSIVRADMERIEWALAELVENAVKFGRAGDKVILIGRRGENATCDIVVQDNGPGICREQLKEIFEPFHQVDGSITRKVGGLGLGLTLAQNIVEAHGSHLWIRSQPGKGTRVGFSLQLAP